MHGNLKTFCNWPLRTGMLLLIVLLLIPAESSGQWKSQFQHGQYRVQAEVSADKVQTAVQNLAGLRQSMSDTLQITLSDQPVNVLIFSSTGSYRNYIRPRVPDAVNRPALFVKAPDALWVYVIYGSGWEVNLRHEMTHAHLHGTLPYLPMWLDEGLAKYFEVSGRQQGWQKDYVSSLTWRYRFRGKVRTRELEGLHDLTEMRSEHYRDSWAWVYFCLHSSPASRKLLQNYLQTIERAEVAGPFFDTLFRDMPQAESALQQYYRSI